MAGEAVIIGEVLVGIIQLIALQLRIAGLNEEEVNAFLKSAFEKALATKPENLPDV